MGSSGPGSDPVARVEFSFVALGGAGTAIGGAVSAMTPFGSAGDAEGISPRVVSPGDVGVVLGNRPEALPPSAGAVCRFEFGKRLGEGWAKAEVMTKKSIRQATIEHRIANICISVPLRALPISRHPRITCLLPKPWVENISVEFVVTCRPKIH